MTLFKFELYHGSFIKATDLTGHKIRFNSMAIDGDWMKLNKIELWLIRTNRYAIWTFKFVFVWESHQENRAQSLNWIASLEL